MAPLAAGLPQGGLLLGISGGGDSMALALLARDWARDRDIRLQAVTVDHGLRAGSAQEAQAVGARLRQLGLCHRILSWEGAKPAGGIENAARQARRRLLTGRARATSGEAAILLAHHRDDQAETVLLRIEGDSGPDGLAAMRGRDRWHGVPVLRPLLGLPKARLLATCRAAGLAWFEDPMNRRPDLARARYRRWRADLAAGGLSPDSLSRFAAIMGRCRDQIDRRTAALFAAHGRIHACGVMELSAAALRALPRPVGERLLRDAVRAVGGGAYPPRQARLARLCDHLFAAPAPGAWTLGGCCIRASADGILWLFPEIARAPAAEALRAGRWQRWGNRFEIRLDGDGPPLRLRQLGAAGWRRLCCLDPAAAARVRAGGLPHAAILALPTILGLDGAMAVPHLLRAGRDRLPWPGWRLRLVFAPVIEWLRGETSGGGMPGWRGDDKPGQGD